MAKIFIRADGITNEIEFKFIENETSHVIRSKLPILSKARTWGDEIYFDTGLQAPSKGATMDVNVGDIAYWPEGRCLCLFFGKTPASRGKTPVPASEVIIIGKTEVDPETLRKVPPGAEITVE